MGIHLGRARWCKRQLPLRVTKLPCPDVLRWRTATATSPRENNFSKVVARLRKGVAAIPRGAGRITSPGREQCQLTFTYRSNPERNRSLSMHPSPRPFEYLERIPRQVLRLKSRPIPTGDSPTQLCNPVNDITSSGNISRQEWPPDRVSAAQNY